MDFKTNSPNQFDEKALLQELQKLKEFVYFVGSHPLADFKTRSNVEEAIFRLDNIVNQEVKSYFSINLDITGFPEESSCIWRRWTVNFEANELQIAAESHNVDEADYDDSVPHYHATIFFDETGKMKQVYMAKDLAIFLKDAENYSIYLTSDLSEVEVSIEL